MPKTYEVTRLKIKGKSIGEVEEMLKPFGYKAQLETDTPPDADNLVNGDKVMVVTISHDENHWAAWLLYFRDRDTMGACISHTDKYLYISDDGRIWDRY